jgi:hypothetical protein
MTDEERQRAMDFIVDQQAKLSVNQQKGDERISRLERILKLMINAGRRTRRQLRETEERLAFIVEHQAKIVEQQAKTVEQQAKTVEQQAKMSVNQLKGEERTSQLERIVRLMISADWRTRRQVTETNDRFEKRFVRLTDALTTLAETQTHTVSRLDALIDVVKED